MIPQRVQRHLLTVVCLLVSAHFSVAYVDLTKPMLDFDGYVQLTPSSGPFYFRMLPALLWKALARIFVPLHHAHPQLRLPSLNPPFETPGGWFRFSLAFVSLFAALLIARRLLRFLTAAPAMEWLCLALAWMAYFDTTLVLNRNLYYPYDLPALFFAMLLVYLAVCNRPVAFAITLAVAMLNKETAIVFVLVYAGLWFGRAPFLRHGFTCAALASSGLAVRIAQTAYLHHVCSACHPVFEVHLRENLKQVANPLFWLAELAMFGFAYLLLIPLWSHIPRRMRWTGTATAAIWLVGMTVVGILREVRIFSELSTLLLLMIATGLLRHGRFQHFLGAASTGLSPEGRRLVGQSPAPEDGFAPLSTPA